MSQEQFDRSGLEKTPTSRARAAIFAVLALTGCRETEIEAGSGTSSDASGAEMRATTNGGSESSEGESTEAGDGDGNGDGDTDGGGNTDGDGDGETDNETGLESSSGDTDGETETGDSDSGDGDDGETATEGETEASSTESPGDGDGDGEPGDGDPGDGDGDGEPEGDGDGESTGGETVIEGDGDVEELPPPEFTGFSIDTQLGYIRPLTTHNVDVEVDYAEGSTYEATVETIAESIPDVPETTVKSGPVPEDGHIIFPFTTGDETGAEMLLKIYITPPEGPEVRARSIDCEVGREWSSAGGWETY